MCALLADWETDLTQMRNHITEEFFPKKVNNTMELHQTKMRNHITEDFSSKKVPYTMQLHGARG